MRPIFCGNFDYDARQSEIQRLFDRYGPVARVDMKSGFLQGAARLILALSDIIYALLVLPDDGFAFVYLEDDRDAADAIRALDNYEFGRQRRRLRVEWAKHADGPRRPSDEMQRRSSEGLKPAKTLFVINFDPIRTRVRDLERHFEPYGKLIRVHIRKNFAFVQYENQDEATKALECTNMSKVLDRVITVEYAIREDGDPPGRHSRSSPDSRGYGSRGGRDYERSSPVYDRRGSPVYDRYRSPPARRRSRSPDYRPYNASR